MHRDILVTCGNAPKMERVVELTVALAERDTAAAAVHLREDFIWTEVGAGRISDFAKLREVLAGRPEVAKISVRNALSHGNGAMCEGELEFPDGSTLYYCSVARFGSTSKNALVKDLHMYFVEKVD